MIAELRYLYQRRNRRPTVSVPLTYLYDNFTRSNGAVGSIPMSGEAWSILGGSPSIISNECGVANYTYNGIYCFPNHPAYQGDGYIEATSASETSNARHIYFRRTGNNYVWAYKSGGTSTFLTLAQVIDGVSTTLITTSSLSWSAGTTFGVLFEGRMAQLYRNRAPVGSPTYLLSPLIAKERMIAFSSYNKVDNVGLYSTVPV